MSHSGKEQPLCVVNPSWLQICTKKEEKIAEENGEWVPVRVELTTLAFRRHQFEPKRDVTTRRDLPLSFFGEICVDSQRVESAD